VEGPGMRVGGDDDVGIEVDVGIGLNIKLDDGAVEGSSEIDGAGDKKKTSEGITEGICVGSSEIDGAGETVGAKVDKLLPSAKHITIFWREHLNTYNFHPHTFAMQSMSLRLTKRKFRDIVNFRWNITCQRIIILSQILC